MRQLFLVLSICLCVFAAGARQYIAKDVDIRNRPFVMGTIEATDFFYDQDAQTIGWIYKGTNAGSLSEAYIYKENIRLRKCDSGCEAFGEERNVPVLTSSGSQIAQRDGCNCWNVNPTAGNGQVTELCFSGNKICYVKFKSNEEWIFDPAKVQLSSNFPNNAFLEDQSSRADCTDECAQVFDIVMVLDESGSINDAEWRDLLAFAKRLVNAFKVGRNDANFALKLYSETGRSLLPLSGSKSTIINQLNNIDKKNGFTCIGCGMQLAYNELQSNKRPGVPGIILTLTDGVNNRPCDRNACGCQNNGDCDCCRGTPPVFGPGGQRCQNCGGRDELNLWSGRAKNAGYKLVSIAVGDNTSPLDLQTITSDWPADHIAVDNFAALDEKLQNILSVICPVNNGNDCGVACNGACHCGQECTCPTKCEPKDFCHDSKCIQAAGFACVETIKDCSDNNQCTTDSCDPKKPGGCVFTPITCDSKSKCIIDECKPNVGCTTKDVVCPVSNKCEVPVCDPITGCSTNTISAADCKSQAPANTRNECWDHWCDPSDGCLRKRKECTGANKCKDYDCDPATGCTEKDKDCTQNDKCKEYPCNPTVGCRAVPKNCTDGKFCTSDVCRASDGMCLNPDRDCTVCQFQDTGDLVDCDAVFRDQLDANKCLEAYCDTMGTATNPPDNCKIRDNTPTCNSNNMCITDSCDITTGKCVAEPVVCQPKDACNKAVCDPMTGCGNEVIPCEPQNACFTAECDPVQGCIQTEKDCNKGDPCKVYSCNVTTGCVEEDLCSQINDCFNSVCVPENSTCVEVNLCDDKNACTIDTCLFDADLYPQGKCNSTMIDVDSVCNDFSVCTNDFCDPAIGCVNNYTECAGVNDTLNCLVADPCDPILGCRTAKFVCEPGDECKVTGCEFINATDTMDAVNRCTEQPVDGVCIPAVAITGISIGAGIIAVIIIAVIVALVLASLAAAKAFQVLTADGLASGGAQNSQIFKPDGVEGESQIFA